MINYLCLLVIALLMAVGCNDDKLDISVTRTEFADGESTSSHCVKVIPIAAVAMLTGGEIKDNHALKVAFYSDKSAFNDTSVYYTNSNEVHGEGYPSGGFKLRWHRIAAGSKITIFFDELIVEHITFNEPTACAIIYDVTLNNLILGIWPFQSIQPSDGTLTFNISGPGVTYASLSKKQMGK